VVTFTIHIDVTIALQIQFYHCRYC